MGLAASQARLLSLTSKISDLELRSQRLTNSKVSLANKTEAISREYAEALDKKGLQVTLPNENGVFVTRNATLNDIYDAGFRLVDRENGNDTLILPPLPTVLKDSDYKIGNFGQPELKSISGQLKSQATSLGKGSGTIIPCAKPSLVINTKPSGYVSGITTAPTPPSQLSYGVENTNVKDMFHERYNNFANATPEARKAFQAYYGINKIVAESMSYGGFSDLNACNIKLMAVNLSDFGEPPQNDIVLGFDLGIGDTPKLRNLGYDSSYNNVIDFIADAYGAETAYRFYTASDNNTNPTCDEIQFMMSSIHGLGSSAYANIASKMRGVAGGEGSIENFSDAVVNIDSGINNAIDALIARGELETKYLDSGRRDLLKASMLSVFGLMTAGEGGYHDEMSLDSVILNSSIGGSMWAEMLENLERCEGNQSERFGIICEMARVIAENSDECGYALELINGSDVRTIFDNMHVGSANGFVQDYYGVKSLGKSNFADNLRDNFTNDEIIQGNIVLPFSNGIDDSTDLCVEIKNAYSEKDNWMLYYENIGQIQREEGAPLFEELERQTNNGYDQFMIDFKNYQIMSDSYLWDANLNYYAGLVSMEHSAFQAMQLEQTAELMQCLDNLGLSYTPSEAYPTLDSFVDYLQAGIDLGQVVMAKGTGYLSAILGYKGSGDGIYLQKQEIGGNPEWIDVLVEETGVLSWARDKSEEAVAEAKYNKALSSVKNKEKAIDRELTKTDTQHRAATTEYDSVKSVIDKNLKDSVGSLFS